MWSFFEVSNDQQQGKTFSEIVFDSIKQLPDVCQSPNRTLTSHFTKRKKKLVAFRVKTFRNLSLELNDTELYS